MICDFDSLPQNSKIWIYQSSRMLEDHELQTINTFLNENIKMWTSHGSALTGSFKILEDRFVILACDLSKNAPSGCSIDSSTKWFKDLSSILNVDLKDQYLDATDALATAVCHHHQSFGKSTKTSYSGWDSFLKNNPGRVAKVKK